MKQAIYFGNISSHVATQPAGRPDSSVTDSTIVFTGFDLSGLDGAFINKLDLLFYHRVNEIGEVLSSLVYISNVLDTDDVTEKTYDVKKLYVNTNAERTLGVTSDLTDFTYFNCKWESTNFFTESISPLSDSQHEELAVNGIPSVKLEQHGIAFDGWYTQMSVGVRVIAGDAVVAARDIIGFHTFADLGSMLSIALTATQSEDDLDWSPYTTILENGTTNPNGSVLVPGTSLANVLATISVDNPYIKQDLFIIPTYVALYDTAVLQYAEFPTYGNPFPVLRDKHRIIHNFAENNQFLEAQYILQTTDYTRMTTQL